MSIYCQRSINGSVEWLGVPVPFSDTGVTWIDNLLCPAARWGYRVRFGVWSWGIQPGFRFSIVDVMLRGAFPARAAYLPRSPENVRVTARHVRDTCLWEHRLARAQNLLHSRHIGGDERVNWSDDDWGDIWDEPTDQ